MICMLKVSAVEVSNNKSQQITSLNDMICLAFNTKLIREAEMHAWVFMHAEIEAETLFSQLFSYRLYY